MHSVNFSKQKGDLSVQVGRVDYEAGKRKREMPRKTCCFNIKQQKRGMGLFPA